MGWDVHFLKDNGDEAFKAWRGFLGGGTVPIGDDIVRNEGGESIFTGPLYWMISPEISSNWTGEPQEWNGDPTTSTRWPMKAELDYVRIYKRGKSEEGYWDTRTDE